MILRSILYAPADNQRALAKAPLLGCDAMIFDLEDAVAPAAKEAAREGLRDYLENAGSTPQIRAIRINGIGSDWFTEDLMAARAIAPDAIVVPKISSTDDLKLVEEALDETDAPSSIRLWAMIETARGVLDVSQIARHGASPQSRLSAMIIGTNDLFKETGIAGPNPRRTAHPWLMQIVLAAKACGLMAIDGVYNDFRDAAGFKNECLQAASMGFDGKTLIHPEQIPTANSAFGPDPAALAEARLIEEAFALPENVDKGVISLKGKMVERLHLDQARRLLDNARAIEAREQKS